MKAREVDEDELKANKELLIRIPAEWNGHPLLALTVSGRRHFVQVPVDAQAGDEIALESADLLPMEESKIELDLIVPADSAPGEVIGVFTPSGTLAAVRLSADALPGASVTVTVDLSASVLQTLKPGRRRFRLVSRSRLKNMVKRGKNDKAPLLTGTEVTGTEVSWSRSRVQMSTGHGHIITSS